MKRAAAIALLVSLVSLAPTTARAQPRFHWRWGGHWRMSRDYQHFSANGR